MHYTKALFSAIALAVPSMAQSSSRDALGCSSSVHSIIQGVPTATGDFGSALTSYASSVASAPAALSYNPFGIATRVCDFSSMLPSSLEPEFTAYASEVVSYVSASSSVIAAVITECVVTGSEGAAYAAAVSSFATHTGPICQVTSAPGGGNETITGTPSPTSSDIANPSIPTAAAAHPTDMFANAAAAAGLLGAVALL